MEKRGKIWETEEEDRDTFAEFKRKSGDESSEARVALRDDYNKLRRSFSRRRFGLSFLFPMIGRLFLPLWSTRLHVITPAGL